MAINFALEIPLGPRTMPFLGHEPNNELWLYHLEDNLIKNAKTAPEYGNYDDLTFEEIPSIISTKLVRDYGVKHLPAFGAFMFFTPTLGVSSKLIIPIHLPKAQDQVPDVIYNVVGLVVNVSINAPEYECYRIELFKDTTTHERIVYTLADVAETSVTVPSTGTYYMTVTGYSNEISVMSSPFEAVVSIS